MAPCKGLVCTEMMNWVYQQQASRWTNNKGAVIFGSTTNQPFDNSSNSILTSASSSTMTSAIADPQLMRGMRRDLRRQAREIIIKSMDDRETLTSTLNASDEI